MDFNVYYNFYKLERTFATLMRSASSHHSLFIIGHTLSLPFSSTEEMMDNESGESMKKEVIGTAPGLKATRTQGHRSKGHRQKATGQKATRTEGHGTKGHCTQGRI